VESINLRWEFASLVGLSLPISKTKLFYHGYENLSQTLFINSSNLN
jgi:hypothetical protein